MEENLDWYYGVKPELVLWNQTWIGIMEAQRCSGLQSLCSLLTSNRLPPPSHIYLDRLLIPGNKYKRKVFRFTEPTMAHHRLALLCCLWMLLSHMEGELLSHMESE